MKVRVIRKPQFTSLHHVQIKRWWWPFWVTVAYDDLCRCKSIAADLINHKRAYEVHMQGESK
jgi:hypothetical protein